MEMNLSYLLYRLKYRFAKHLPLRSPVDVSLELASHCNQACGYCYHADPKNMGFVKGYMSYELAEKIIRDAAQHGVHSLKFNYRGESSMNPHFFKITSLAKSLAHGSTFIDRLSNSNFKFDTNREDIFHGFCNQTKVKISFDSFIDKVMHKQRAGSNHALALANIDRFYNHPIRKHTETQIVIQAVRTVLNKDEDIAGEVARRWPEATVSIRDMVAGRVENKKVGELENKKRDFTGRQSCIQAHARLIVHWDGRVGPCCPSTKNNLIVGDMTKQTIYEVFNSKNSKDLRADLKSGKAFDLDPCKTCSSFESFKGYKAPFHA